MFRIKPQLLELMIDRAVAAGIPFGWVTADEAYGDNVPLRASVAERGIAYVLAVARAHVLASPAGGCRADALARKLARRAWQRVSCGDGGKGERRYDWALVAAARRGRPARPATRSWAPIESVALFNAARSMSIIARLSMLIRL